MRELRGADKTHIIMQRNCRCLTLVHRPRCLRGLGNCWWHPPSQHHRLRGQAVEDKKTGTDTSKDDRTLGKLKPEV
ncbi:hypothetical protein M407DRAFT_197738 [Tulasnella calospora MUT 4182]|uniref:Uncharacterized protein n=1 Tax=Tulasnella calospora MUT 4182 TaxID=1051891 RepID=A0A0C3PNI3_9AGAM|nr:hypothetical protein M407DRAFT_197738 [Tulasnella calospora MUT 4182]